MNELIMTDNFREVTPASESRGFVIYFFLFYREQFPFMQGVG